MLARTERRFLAILGLSLGFHVAVLALVRGPAYQPPLPSLAMTANLRIAAAAASVQGSAAVAPGVAPEKAVRQPVPGKDAPRLSRQAAATSAATAPAVADRPVPVAAGAAAETAPPAAVSAIAEAPPSPAAPHYDPAALLDGYGHRLSELFARQQGYPRLAEIRGWEGEVLLRLRVARKGNLVAVQLDRSSGHDVLDQHALQLMQQLRGLPPFPDGLDAPEVQVVVPVNYRLRRPA